MSNNHFFYPRNVIESVIQNLDSLISSTNVKTVLEHSRQIAKLLQCENEYGLRNFFRLKSILNVKTLSKWNRVASILKALDQKANQKEYAARSRLQEKKILVIGGGLSGLRVAIELVLIGAKVICIEKRDEFSRNNVIHLWPNVINDMYTFEAKRLYGQFCVGSIDHISIRQLQLLLLKIALIYGVRFVPNVAFEEICPRIIEPNECKCLPDTCNCCCHSHGFGGGAYAHFKSPQNPFLSQELSRESFDTIIGCDGHRNTFSRYFPRNNRRGKLAIGLTANYVNRRTEEEAHCPEISGISRIYNQKWFKDLLEETGIELENLVYYRDETHYFVMTATKASLLRRGVLRCDYGDSHALLSNSNIDISLLMKYSKDAAMWSSKLKRLEFALNSSNKPDVALFDFTSMYSATNASCAKKTYLKCCGENVRKSGPFKYTLMLLCGDSLLEPFWPTGSGAGRGFLSALDAAWTVNMWYSNISDETTPDIDTMLNVISKREYVYRLLAQTNPENTTSKNFTIDPQTRYKNLNLRDSRILQEIKNQVRHLIIDKNDLTAKNYMNSYEAKRARRATVGINPDDVLKAKHLSYQPPKAFEDFHERNLSAFSDKPLYSVPSSSSVKTPIYNCDNLPIEVLELKPKNPGQLSPAPSSNPSPDPSHIDFKPRNNETSSFNRPNYQPRNHFSSSNWDELKPTELTSSKKNSGDLDSFGNNNKASLVSPAYKAMYGVDDIYSDHDDNNTRYSGNYSNRNSSIQNRRDFLSDYQRSRSGESSYSQNYQKMPAKSADIVEKAQYLEHKLEELKKPFSPTLAKVGKIEDEDWNVKIWNSTEIFEPKVPDRKNMVHDNSKELLQSRIKQLNNNFSGSSYRDDLLKSVSRNRVTNEYVNLLSNEVSQKFANSGLPKAEPLQSFELLKANNDATDKGHSDPYYSRTTNLKTVELLKPLGECKRCNKPITAIDRVSVLGQNYHKTCLTCKACSIMLRQDELLNDDFVCKICRKSRANTYQPDARSSFFTTPLSGSLIEAKKNFLVNIEQIDLRERAEFEIVDESEDAKVTETELIPTIPPQQQPETEEFEPIHLETVIQAEVETQKEQPQTTNFTTENFTPNEANSSQSDLTESDPNSTQSDTNYTDDEHSDSDCEEGGVKQPDEFMKELLLKDETSSSEPSELPQCESQNLDANANEYASVPAAVASVLTASIIDHSVSSATKGMLTISASSGVENSGLNATSLTASAVGNKATNLPVTSTTNNNKLHFAHRIPAYASMTMSYPNSDSSLVLDKQFLNRSLIDRAFGSKVPTYDRKVEKAAPDDLKGTSDGKTGELPYRYSGQFMEKFYRTHSQPTLYEQLNHIDRKLKKSSALPPLSHEDMPFADSHEDLSSSQPIICSDKLFPAPVADLEDV